MDPLCDGRVPPGRFHGSAGQPGSLTPEGGLKGGSAGRRLLKLDPRRGETPPKYRYTSGAESHLGDLSFSPTPFDALPADLFKKVPFCNPPLCRRGASTSGGPTRKPPPGETGDSYGQTGFERCGRHFEARPQRNPNFSRGQICTVYATLQKPRPRRLRSTAPAHTN